MTSLDNFLQYDLTLALLLVCLGFFGFLALRSRKISSFQFQLSVFVAIWTIGEMTNVFLQNGVISLPYSEYLLGYEVHLLSMVFFGALLWFRYILSSAKGKKLEDDIREYVS